MEDWNIILGPPGTGKTTTLLKLIESELENGTHPDRIGYFTFTKKASAEGRERAMAKFELTAAQLPYFRTLHSFAFQQLGLGKEDVMSKEHYKEFGEALGLRLTGSMSSDEGTIMSLTKDDRLMFIENLARMQCVPLEKLYHEHDHNVDWNADWYELERLARALRNYKDSTYLMDFTDMLADFCKVGETPPFDVVFIDEAQDLSPLQWEVVKKITSKAGKVYIAGDDDQAIFRWAGADVDYFVKISKNNATVLDQSYRVPSLIHDLADKVIHRVGNRVEKSWNAKPDEGSILMDPYFENIEMHQDSWLLMARSNYHLDRMEAFCREEGYFFERKGRTSISQRKVHAIQDWGRLNKGEMLNVADVKNCLQYIKRTKVKDLEHADVNLCLSLRQLRKSYGVEAQGTWHNALDRLTVREVSYLRAMLRRGEKITKNPRIVLSTIHGAKGGEADNVVLLTDLSQRTFKSYEKNPDDETRVMYVGLTRAKKTLHLVEPMTNRYFPL